MYAAVCLRSFRRYSTYRAATGARVFTNTVFGFILSYTYLALWQVRPHLGGYDLSAALTYVWIGQGLLSVLAINDLGALSDLQTRIANGDVAVDLFRPVDQQRWWLAVDAGRAGYQLLTNALVPMLVGGLFFHLRLPQGTAAATVATWAATAVALLLALLVSYAMRHLIALTGFWLLDLRGVQLVYYLVSCFFSGFFLPITTFPPLLEAVARALPFVAVFQVPADVFLQRYDATGTLAALGVQVAWAVVLLGLGRLVQSRAVLKVVVQGG
ncbi:ABC transporter permease [Streptacidiphilus pinicola]|uniref:ABC transporter permease n=1 Tax=Streptacidiphilus pinicola TaxID=2219663 RepID=A0A2X0ITY4_9ACTN|nr:ABC-2 family transporter protein [Streptacidiphilus pinicola]RAG81036.1 ABC transporter permease [Streptacidiphilus pinicola]